MPALDALMPTHATIAASVRSVSSRITDHASRSEPIMFKYLIVEDRVQLPRVTLFSRDLCHRDLVPAGANVLSAGFCCLYQDQLQIPNISSDTLNVNPRPQDKRLITSFLGLSH